MVHWSYGIAFGLLAVMLIGAAVTDWRSGRILNVWTYPAILIGLVYWIVAGFATGGLTQAQAWGLAATGAMLAGLIPMAIIFAAGGLGGGDVKLMAAVGALSGNWACVLGTAVYGFLIAGLMALIVMVQRRIVKRTLQRLLGAALSAAARVKPDIPEDSPRIPFGVAICIGGLIAGSEHLLGVKMPWGAW